MAVIYGTQSQHAELRLTAIEASSRQPIRHDCRISLQRENGTLVQASEANPAHFKLHEGSYYIVVDHNQESVTLPNVALKATECLDLIITVPLQKDPHSYYIEESDQYDAFTEHQRRQAERAGQNHYGLADGELAEPVSREQAQHQRNAMYARQMGPKAHPLLQKPQFDGIDQNVTPKPDENQQVELALQKQLENALQPGQISTPKPPTG